MMHRSYEVILSRLERVRPARRWPLTWYARCPAHDDREPSLMVWVGRSGAFLARCLSNRGCTWQAIAAAIGTETTDWFPPREERLDKRRMKAMPTKEQAAVYEYTDEAGHVIFEVVRYRDEDGNKSFSQRRPRHDGRGYVYDLDGVTRPLYRVHEVIAAAPERTILIVEGEKDVESLVRLGLIATCNPGGAGKWLLDHGRHLRGRKVAIIPDHDAPGAAHAIGVAGNLMYWGASSIRIVHVGGPSAEEGYDVSDWLADALPSTTDRQKKQALIELIQSAPEWRLTVKSAA